MNPLNEFDGVGTPRQRISASPHHTFFADFYRDSIQTELLSLMSPSSHHGHCHR